MKHANSRGATLKGPKIEPIYRPPLPEEVATRIRKMIDDGTLMPGSRIPERQVCAQLGISRTPLREAFRALASQGLLDVQPRRGAMVKKLQPDDVDYMFEVLEALERVAGELACERASDSELTAIEALHKKMMACYRRKDRKGFFRINQDIHEAVVKAAANPVLTHVYEGLSGQIRRIRYLPTVSDAEWAIAITEHEAIVKALKARNRAAAGTALRTHLNNKRKRVKRLLVA